MILIILCTILFAIICYFVIFIMIPKRVKVKQILLLTIVVVYAIFKAVKYKLKTTLSKGILPVIYKKISHKLHQPYYCTDQTIQYELNGKIYKMKVETELKHTKPSYFILSCKDGTSKKEDVTNQLESWIGPNHNFHNTKLTPGDIGYTKLIIIFSIGDKIILDKDDLLPNVLIKI